jgi:hypothetical protein
MLNLGVLSLFDMHVVSAEGLSSVASAGWSHEGHSESGSSSTGTQTSQNATKGWLSQIEATVARYKKVAL